MSQNVRRLRLFFALWPDDATRAALAAWSESLYRRTGGRAMRPETLHITLAFLGETDAAVLDALLHAAAQVAPPRFELVIDELGYWRHNQIAWAGVRSPPPELDQLVTQLRAALIAAQARFDPKPFVPHLTLIRKARGGFKLPRVEPIRWPVHEFVLVRSETTAEGSEYAIQARWG